jgi:predicted negative regulator of RcsB-dependent stress response
MNPQQLLGIVLIVAAVGLMAWSMWPAKKQEQEQKQPEPNEVDDEIEAVENWAEIHAAIAELHILLTGNNVARTKLNELGASMYDMKNWEQSNEPVQ